MRVARATISRRMAGLSLVLAIGLCLAACVTEKPQSRGSARSSADAVAKIARHINTPSATPANAGSGTSVSLPAGPIGTPAKPIGSSVSRVVVNVLPLGTVPYDGQVLPLVSPSGALLAVEEGDAPTWSTLIAAGDATATPGTRIAVYDISKTPITRVEHPEVASGVMLGRGCDDAGVLVEQPREDGSRWIGKLAWASGRIEWLVQGRAVNAHATLTPSGELLFTRRAIGGGNAELVLRRDGGIESVRTAPDGSYEFPFADADESVVYALVRTQGGVDIEAIRVGGGDRSTRALGATLARRQIVRSSDDALPYQIAASSQGALPRRPGDDAPAWAACAIFHPGMRRMASFDPRGAAFAPLASDSMAAVRWESGGTRGWFCTTPQELVFLPDADVDPAAAKRGVTRILAAPLIPRVTTDPKRPLVVVGPVKTDPMRLQITAVSLGE